MQHSTVERISWRQALAQQKPLVLPVAHDALTARLIENAGFKAYQIGGFAVAAALRGAPLATNILEHGGKTPWTSPAYMGELGFTMILYPTTLLFRVTRALQDGLEDLKRAMQISDGNSVDMEQSETIVDLPYWADLEKRFGEQEQ